MIDTVVIQPGADTGEPSVAGVLRRASTRGRPARTAPTTCWPMMRPGPLLAAPWLQDPRQPRSLHERGHPAVQLRCFRHLINADKVFGTHTDPFEAL